MTTPTAHYVALSCGAMARSIYAAAADSISVVTVDVLEQGLHETPDQLRDEIQQRIDAVAADSCDAILLAYGLCGGAAAGLIAREVPLVLPRAHDCITLYLGSRRRYQEEFGRHPGTYWMSRDYLERNRSGDLVSLGVSPGVEARFVEKYGRDNAEYLMQTMGAWTQHYDRIAYIETSPGGGESFKSQAAAKADTWCLQFATLTGDRRLVTALVEGAWDPDEFLVVQPGHQVVSTSGDAVVVARKVPTRE